MRLLLAEDERMLSEALVSILTHNRYSVDAVYDGQEALDYLENGEYDGAILDIMMPKLDGLTVLRRLRAAGKTLPVLMLTAKGELNDRVEGLDSGADDYLTKPFASRELLARIRAMTRRQPGLQQTDLSFGGLTLHRAEGTLRGPAGVVHLGNKEFQIMEMLMQNPARASSTERLLEKIWGYETESGPNTVWVYISGLRKKLAELESPVQIRASRGVGYFLEELG